MLSLIQGLDALMGYGKLLKSTEPYDSILNLNVPSSIQIASSLHCSLLLCIIWTLERSIPVNCVMRTRGIARLVLYLSSNCFSFSK